jgi:hypothetical protein
MSICCSPTGFAIGQLLTIGAGTPHQEERTIMGFGSLVLDKPLAHDHAKGEQFSARPTVSPPASNRPTDPRHPIKPNVDSYDTHQGRWLFILMARPLGPLILFSTHSLFPTVECGDCQGTKSITGKEDQYSYFGPFGPMALNTKPGPLPKVRVVSFCFVSALCIDLLTDKVQPLSNPKGTRLTDPVYKGGDGVDWVAEELAKYSHQPLPKYGDFGAPIKTNQPDNLKRQGGFPNGASPPGSVLRLDVT